MFGSSNRVRKVLENVFLGLTGIVSLAIALLDLVGVLDANSWIAQRIPSLTLLAIGSISSYLILESRSQLEQMNNDLEQHGRDVETLVSRAIRSLDGVEVKIFSDGAKFYEYFLSRMQEADKVDDISWNERFPFITREERDVYSDYRDVVARAARRPNVVWREILIFLDESHFEQVRPLLLHDLPNYHVVFYNPPPKNTPPRISFAIVDDEEIFFAGQTPRMVVRHPDIVEYFSRYYQRIWEPGNQLKIGDDVDIKCLESIASSLSSSEVH